MNASLTVGQRRRRLVDAALWSLMISVGMLYLVAPAAERLIPSGWTLVLAVYFYVPVISTAMMVAYSYFGYGIEGYDVLKPQAWAAMFIAVIFSIGISGGRGVLWLSMLSITYLLCERFLPEPVGNAA